MSKIFISQETLKKLSSSDKSQKYSNLIKAFDINRPEPKRHQTKINKKAITNTVTNNKKTKSKSTQIRRITLKHPPKKQKKKTIVKHLMGEITEHRYPRNVYRPATFSYAPRRNSSKPISNQSPGKKTPVSSKYMFDYSSSANEYESRQIEFGHGRAKSKEWNDEIAKKFQKQLKGTRNRKRDWTDRFALK